ncbi:unnamed protein product [Mycena citricolor]|uniref:ferric-chelate reductase (NADPH) n=1 Tax=Mycena citricolor TaxID=2018698 RepID=A0AAD2HDJ0_9AGAR|nr:unnamed protein product [Mycena citricolor]
MVNSTLAAPASAVAAASFSTNASGFVYHVDIFLMAVAATVLLYRLPRAAARFWRYSEWSTGHWLHYVQPKPSPKVVMSSRGAIVSPKELDSELSHSAVMRSRHARRVDADGAPIRVEYPPHVPNVPALLRPLTAPLSIRISPGFTVARVVVLLLYTSILVYPLSVATAGPFVDLERAGWIAISQLPLVILFASKNNVLAMLLGTSYERLNFFHRFAARLFVLGCNAHGLGHIFVWAQAGDFQAKIKIPSFTYGTAGLVAVNVMYVFSTSFFRSKYYRFFLSTHVICFAVLFPMLWFHYAALHAYILVALGFYALDHVLRLVKTRMYNAILRPLTDMGVTRVEVPQATAGWRPGQHVRLRVLSSSMGITGWTESHPFTIAGVAGTNEGLVLMIKKSGKWTTRLFDFAKSGGYLEAGIGRNVSVIVEGPYGGPGHAMWNSYSSTIFVAGGSGISFALSGIQDLIQKDLHGQSRVRLIELIWVVQDPTTLLPLYQQFNAMIDQSVFTRLRISVFYTRAPVGKFPFAESAFPTTNLSLSPGRPRLVTMLENSIGRTVKLGAGSKDDQPLSGMLVAVCGPCSLADSVSEAISQIEPLRRDQVGGLEIHEEVFGL